MVSLRLDFSTPTCYTGSMTITAKRESDCHLCSGLISPGDRIETHGGQWVHVHADRNLGHVAGIKFIQDIRKTLAEMA